MAGSCGTSPEGGVAPINVPDNMAAGLVQGGWAQAQAFASSAFTEATTFLDELTTVGSQLANIDDISVDVASPSMQIGDFVLPDAPVAPDGMAMVLPALPVEPTITSVPGLSLPDAPSFAATMPAINLDIARPDALSATIPTEPTLIDVPIPAEPTVALPDVPTLTSLEIPAAPTINLPSFIAELADAPSVDFDTSLSFTEPTYVSELLTVLKAKLLDWVNGASTGIEADVEQAIWDRGRAREDVNSLRSIDEVTRSFASRGFSMPPGALLTATMEVVQEAQNKNSSFSRDVAIKQADLEQSNRRFAVEQSWQVESGLLTYANQVAQRAFDLARFTLQTGIDVFRARVERFNAQVQAYRTEAEVYRARIEAEISIIEIYKAQLDGQRLVGEINMQQVEIYKSRIQAVNSMIELYNSKVNAANTKASINKTLIEGFGVRVQAYDSIVKAKASEYDAYATNVKAEISKSEVYKVQAEAYTGEVEGYAALVEARVKEIDANIRVNQEVPLELYKQRALVFGEVVRAESARVSALADLYRTDGSVYQSMASAEAARVGAQADGYRSESQLLLGRANVILDSAKANVQKVMTSIEMLTESIKAGAQVASQLAAASLSSVNLSGSISNSMGYSNSYNAGVSKNWSIASSHSCSDTYIHTD